jgi:oligopeptidase A
MLNIYSLAWDCFIRQVELPSQFMENWMYDKTTVDLVSGHYKTGEALPNDVFKQVCKGIW